MITIRIKFVDFWYGFSETNNYFYNLLIKNYNILIVDDPDILIYSCYGNTYLNYNCIKIFYTAENLRPDFLGCDYAITFDYIKNKRHLRFPLYGMYIDNLGPVDTLTKQISEDEARKIWRTKTKFCCIVVSNGLSKKRLDFYKKLNKIKVVDSGGRLYNNVGGPVKDKIKFINDYKFVISFENSSYPGYTTEKIIEPFYVSSIPIYWGDPLIFSEFNANSFIHLSDLKTDDELISEILEINENEDIAIKMLTSSKFKQQYIPESIQKEKVIAFFNTIILNWNFQNPVSKNLFYKKVHLLKKLKYRILKRISNNLSN